MTLEPSAKYGHGSDILIEKNIDLAQIRSLLRDFPIKEFDLIRLRDDNLFPHVTNECIRHHKYRDPIPFCEVEGLNRQVEHLLRT